MADSLCLKVEYNEARGKFIFTQRISKGTLFDVNDILKALDELGGVCDPDHPYTNEDKKAILRRLVLVTDKVTCFADDVMDLYPDGYTEVPERFPIPIQLHSHSDKISKIILPMTSFTLLSGDIEIRVWGYILADDPALISADKDMKFIYVHMNCLSPLQDIHKLLCADRSDTEGMCLATSSTSQWRDDSMDKIVEAVLASEPVAEPVEEVSRGGFLLLSCEAVRNEDLSAYEVSVEKISNSVRERVKFYIYGGNGLSTQGKRIMRFICSSEDTESMVHEYISLLVIATAFKVPVSYIKDRELRLLNLRLKYQVIGKSHRGLCLDVNGLRTKFGNYLCDYENSTDHSFDTFAVEEYMKTLDRILCIGYTVSTQLKATAETGAPSVLRNVIEECMPVLDELAQLIQNIK